MSNYGDRTAFSGGEANRSPRRGIHSQRYNFATAFDFEFGGSGDSEQTRTLLAQTQPIGK